MRLALIMLFASSSASAQTATSYPLLDRIASAVVQKYQTSSCEQLAAEKLAPKSAQKEAAEARLGQQLQRDPAMRAALVSKVAAPVVDKMIACGFIP